MKLNKISLTGFQLKIIAIVTMLIDHIGIVIGSNNYIYGIMRTIGRISFPIFAFMLVEGFFHTHNRKKHGYLLLIFAIISEPIYDIFGHLVFKYPFIERHNQNIMFTLLLGYLTIWAIEKLSVSKKPLWMVSLMQFLCIILGTGLAIEGGVSYSFAGFFLVVLFYYGHKLGDKKENYLIGLTLFNIMFYKPSRQWYSILASLFISLYNGKPGGKKKYKYFFYLFYPIHLAMLCIIKWFLM